MMADLLVDRIVPLAVIVAMLTVGLNLDLSALRDSLRQPRSLLLCTILQIVLLPAAVLGLIALLSPPPLLALVMFMVAISPGGTLSNALTHLAGGNLALSVVMTVATTLLVAATAPASVALASSAGALGLGASADLSPLAVGFDLLKVSLLPICLGVALGVLMPGPVARLRPAADVACALAIAVVVVCSAIVSWPVVRDAPADYLGTAAALSLALLGAGTAVARLLPAQDRSACVIEFSVRNLPIAIVLAGGAGRPEEIVAFLLCHFVINTALLLALAAAGRPTSRRTA